MRKLFVSYTSLLREVSLGRVTDQDLQQGLFYFGCWRQHVMHPGEAGEADELTWNDGKHAHAYPVIIKALVQAEADGRAAWHNDPERHVNPWQLLDELLGINGLSTLAVAHDVSCHYSYPGVHDAVAAKGLELQVVY